MINTVLELGGVAGRPRVRYPLSIAVLVGERIRVQFRVQRRKGGRTDVLEVDGDVRVAARCIEAVTGTTCQVLTVEPVGDKPFTWRSVKNVVTPVRTLAPAHFPPTRV